MIEALETDVIKFSNYILHGIFMITLNVSSNVLSINVWNKSMKHITEYDQSEINEKTLLHIVKLEESTFKNTREISGHISRQKNIENKILSIKTKSGVDKIVDMGLSFINDKDNIVLIGSLKDITEGKIEEKRLEEIELRYERLINNSNDAIIIYDDFKILYVNKKTARMLEAETIDEIIGENLLTFIDSEYHDLVRKRTKVSFMQNQVMKPIEEKLVTKKGNIVDIECQLTNIPYENKKCNIAFIRDITKRKQVENKLKKREKYFKKLFNNISDSVYVNKIDEEGLPSFYTDANDIACDWIGYSREELRKMTVFEAKPHLNKEQVIYVVNKLKEGEEVTYESIDRGKNGDLIPVEVKSIYLTLDDERYILSISRDISERKKNERILKKKADEYIKLVQAIPYGIYIMGTSTMLFANKVGLEYMGLDNLEDVMNKDYDEIMVPHYSYIERYKKNFDEFRKRGYKPLTEEKLIRLKDKTVIDLETIVIKYPYGEREDTFLVVARDISERKKIEALERDMNEKTKQLEQVAAYEKMRTEFFANISHELRTPVNVIFSALQLISCKMARLKDTNYNFEQYEKNINIMRQNCFRLVRLINNLIDVTKIDSGYLSLNLVNCDIINIVEDITQSVAQYIDTKGLTLIFDTEVEEKVMACDPEKIERVMLNLISNAVKFTNPGGSVFVNIKDKLDSIVISVRDTGRGIPKEKQAIIFERFMQVDKSLARQNEGSGIGLSLVKSLVEMHKGTISVKSEENKGSEFFVELPVYTVEGSEYMEDASTYIIQDNVEKINIEFSDIYF